MAKMGKGEVTSKRGGSPSPPDLTRGTARVRDSVRLHIVVPTGHIAATTTIAGSPLGIPIMREGFVTETGLLPPSSASAHCASTGLF